MKFALKIPEKWLPDSWKNEVESFNKALKTKKNINRALVVRRQHVADMKQDDLKLAIQYAEQPERPRRDLLYEMYRQAVKDGHFTGEYEKAINKVVGAPFGVYKIGSEEIDKKATRLLNKNWFEDYRTYHEEAVFWGHSLIQFMDLVPSNEEGLQMEFREIELVERDHVRPEEGYIVRDISDETGLPFRDPTIAKTLGLIEIGKPKSLGKLQIICREYIWKNYSRSDWSRHSEKFGMPMVAIKSSSRDAKELDRLEDMASNFGNNLWMLLDGDDEVDLKEPTFKDSYQIYKEKVLMCNDEMSKAATWQTGTSDEKAFVGSTQVHADILDDYTEWRKRKQTYHINDVLFPFLIENGYPLQGMEFKYLTYKELNPETEQEEKSKENGSGGAPEKKPTPARQRALYKYRV